jgi:hypothetical protein
MVENLLISLIVACLFFARHYFIQPAKTDRGPAVITFEADLGPVTFYHKKHQVYVKGDCVTCHHKIKDNSHTCRTCHKKKKDTLEGDPIPFFDVKMSLCRGCHQKLRDDESSQTAPIHCNECHDVKKIKWSKP